MGQSREDISMNFLSRYNHFHSRKCVWKCHPENGCHGCFSLNMLIWQPLCVGLKVLTHWSRDKMTAIFQTTFSNAFSWMKMVVYWRHRGNVIMSAMASQIISLTIVYSTVYSGADQRNHQSSASLAFVRGVPLWVMNSGKAENVSIWWRHHGMCKKIECYISNTHNVVCNHVFIY